MLLSDVLEGYFLRNLKIRDEATKRKYRYALADFKDAVGRPPRLEDLCDDNVAAMMNMLIQRGRSVVTANDKRKRIHALWTWLAKRGQVQQWPTTPQLPEPRKIPTAWTLDELERLIVACRFQPGWIAGVKAGHWWYALHLVLWDTGERIGAIMQLAWPAVDLARGWITVPAEIRKGKAADAAHRIAPSTVDALRAIENPVRDLVFPWDRGETYLWGRYAAILKQAGLPADRRHKFHAMRRSVASHVKRLGGDAQQALGHESAATTALYLDPRITGQQQPADLLPRLWPTASELPPDQRSE